MRRRLALILSSALVGAFGVSAATAQAAPLNSYFDGNDLAVASALPDQFRLNPATLEPGCYPVPNVRDFVHVDLGDLSKSVHITVPDNAPFSVDQLLVPGIHSGYQVYNSFDTGTVNNDPDIDPNQTALDITAPGNDVIDPDELIACVSDHDDAVLNRPYVSAAGGEVAAVNRPIITPTIAALGASAIEPLHTYKVGFGYTTNQWYAAPVEGLDLTDPMAFPLPDPTHLNIPARIAQAGVLRINDIDEFGEQFADPHFEQAQYDQIDTFFKDGDPFAFLHDSHGLLTFTTQGDLPLSWTLKASLAPESYTRSVTLTDNDLRQWEQDWQDYYTGKGPKPTLPLAPGTNSPEPLPGVIVNLPESAPAKQPAALTGSNQVLQVVQKQAKQQVAGRCTSNRKVRFTMNRKASRAVVRYRSTHGMRTIRAHRSHGRLRATINLGNVNSASGQIVSVQIREKIRGHWRTHTRLLKVC